MFVKPPLTLAQALALAAEQLQATSPTPRLDAELLLGHVLGWPRARVLSEGRAMLAPAQLEQFQRLVVRRTALEPVAYIVGHKAFYGLDLLVTPDVLVPRPETELLVEQALACARSRPASPALRIADIGTGSGAIAVALAAHLPQARIYASDASAAALAVAARNLERYGLGGRVQLLHGDLLEPLPEPVDLLVSNPPYTVLTEIDAPVRRYEPHLALDGGPDGLSIYRRLLARAPAALRPGSALMLEIGATQAKAVTGYARQAFPEATIRVHQDLAGWDRVVAVMLCYSGACKPE